MSKTNADGNRVLQQFIDVIAKKGMKYDKVDEATVETGGRGDDMVIFIRGCVDFERDIFHLYSPFDFNISPEKMNDAAMAICSINDILTYGSFDLNIKTGRVCFRANVLYKSSLLSDELMEELLEYSIFIVDEFNDKIDDLEKGKRKYDQMIE